MIPVGTALPPVTVTIEQDTNIEDPSTHDGQWKLHSFGRRHNNYRDPDALGLGELDEETRLPKVLNPGLRRKLAKGLAFFCSYFEHGGSVWSLIDQGPQCRWDSVRVAGLLVWEHPSKDMGARTYQEREKDAASFLECYTAWWNGEGYWYSCKDEEGSINDSCGGFLGTDLEHMFGCIKDAIGDRDVRFVGEAKDLAKSYWKGPVATGGEED